MKTTTYFFAAVLLVIVTTQGVFARHGEEKPSVEGAGKVSAGEFASPPDEFRPWCYYWWLKGNVTPESITRDLTEMREKGFGGLLLFDSRGYHEDAENHIPVPLKIQNEFMSESWRRLAVHLFKEADRLGLKVSVNISDSGGHLRGPWDFGADGPRQLVWCETTLQGPRRFAAELPSPGESRYFRDVAILAVRVDLENGKTEAAKKASASGETVSLGGEWKQASLAEPAENAPLALEVIDLTEAAKKASENRFEAEIPEGTWKILRFGSVVIGDVGSVDILNAEIVEKYFNLMPGRLLDDAGPLAGRTLTHFYNVSWEGSEPDWTDNFDRFFLEKRGYAVFPYFPIFCGMTVKAPETNRLFLGDFRKTVADAFRERCYRRIGELCHARSVGWHSENGGPWNRKSPMFADADMLTFWGENDFPQGEFWVSENGALPQTNARFASNAARLYGRDRTAVEAFTHMVRHWTVSPRTLKPAADQNFIDGANHFIWHTFTASPPEAGRPGFEYFAGSHINPNVTWQPESGGFLAYLARCQYLLRRGRFVADLAVYTSDRNHVNWGRGGKWSGAPTLSPPKGFAYDLLDTPSLVERLEWRDGRFRLAAPDGSEAGAYRYLILDPAEEALPLSVLKKIDALIEAGGTVLLGSRRPTGFVGLLDEKNHEGEKIISKLWGSDSAVSESAEVGKGRIIRGIAVEKFLADEKFLPDFILANESATPFEYHHRRTAAGDIYFVTGKGKGEAVFRADGKTVELWDAVNGKVYAPESVEKLADCRTKIAVELPENGSVFVLFKNELLSKYENNYHFGISNPPSLEGIDLNGPWRVAFDEKLGGPGEVDFQKLTRWNENETPGIRYFSGTAVYQTAFSISADEYKEIEKSKRLELSLGAVNEIARVRLNGVDLGAVWTAPWILEPAKGILRAGKNELEIAVTNVWANRLIGDAGLPPEERITRTNVQYFPKGVKKRPHQGFTPDSPLRPSGLSGPVRLEWHLENDGKNEK